MRWLREAVTVVMLTAILAGVLFVQWRSADREAEIDRLSADLRRMDLEIKYRAATGKAELNAFGWPARIDPHWFGEDVPRNTLLSGPRPWLEIAGVAEAPLVHPPIRMAVEDDDAGFWYNPARGIIRARVPVMVSDGEATLLYNRVNRTTLRSIFESEPPHPDAEAITRMAAEGLRPVDGEDDDSDDEQGDGPSSDRGAAEETTAHRNGGG